MPKTTPQETVELTLGGRTLSLQTNLPALKKLHALTGRNILAGQNPMDAITAENLPLVLHALAGSPKEHTPQWIEEQINRSNLLDVYGKIGRVLAFEDEPAPENPS